MGHRHLPASLHRRLVRSALMAIVAWAALPGTASAHVGGRIGTDFQARLAAIRPRSPWVSATVLGGDLELELTVARGHTVIVYGLVGEPFLRFSPAGVAANRGSPTAWSTGVVSRADATRAGGRPVWRRVSDSRTFAWHENRLRPRASVTGGATPRRVAPWSIPMLVDGVRARATGWEWFATGPPLAPWVVTAAVIVAAAAVTARYGSRRLRWHMAAGLLATTVTAWLAGWTGILLSGRPSMLIVGIAVAYAVVTVGLVGAALEATSGDGRVVAAATVAAVAAAFTIPEVAVFTHGFVLSRLPATAARIAVLLSLAGGAAVAVLGIPTVAEILRDDPLRRRLLPESERVLR